MSSISPVRRLTAGAAVLAAGVAGALAAAPVADASPDTTSAPASVTREARQTTITFELPGCDGCVIGLVQGRWDPDSKWGAKVWDGGQHEVVDGVATVTVPSRRTKGMSMTVEAPWEGHTGYITQTVFRYGGKKVGDEVGFKEARSKSKGAACWAGTRETEVTVPVTVRKVWVQGLRHRVRGSIAYTSVTQDWMVPMRDVWNGVMGTQDVQICGKRPRG
jgi:hypothetical protein